MCNTTENGQTKSCSFLDNISILYNTIYGFFKKKYIVEKFIKENKVSKFLRLKLNDSCLFYDQSKNIYDNDLYDYNYSDLPQQGMLDYYDIYFANGGDRTTKNVPEMSVCKNLDVTMLWGIGGGKIQSSSWLIKGEK